MTRRLEITVSEGTWARLDAARGHEPRASFVKRALESALGTTVGGVTASESPAGAGSAPSRASVKKTEVALEVRDAVRKRGQAKPPVPSPLAARQVPGVRPAREFVLDPRQAALNKARKA